MGRREGLSSDKPKAPLEKPVNQDLKTKSDIRGTKPTGVILDQMRDLAAPTSFDPKPKSKAPKGT